MGKATSSPIIDQARLLLDLFNNSSEAEIVHHADDILSYFTMLRDKYGIAKSGSPRFSGHTFSILQESIYQLESNPDSTMRNDGFKEFIRLVLEDIATVRIQLVLKSPSQKG